MKKSNLVSRETINCVVMFADVAGSTAMYENMGDDLARERISKALNALISISRRHSGKLVKTIGDEILVYVTDIDMAVFAAKAIQETMEDDRSPETIGVSIRIGMQLGVLEILCQFFNVQHNAVRRIDNDRQIRF